MDSPCFLLISLFCATLLQFTIHPVLTWGPINPAHGFISLPLNNSNLEIQRPYDVPECERSTFIHGVQKLWVYSTDKPHSLISHTSPRTEIRVRGYDYSSGVWQFEGYGRVPCSTTGVCIMQVFGASPHATTLMLRVYNGSLMYYQQQVLVPDIYDRWFKLNVIHDVDASKVKVFVDGELKLEVDGRGGNSHYFKCGVYAQNNDSYYMESQWNGIKVLKKCD